MLTFVCGALGVLGTLLFGTFLWCEIRETYQQGRAKKEENPLALYGCILLLTSPFIGQASCRSWAPRPGACSRRSAS